MSQAEFDYYASVSGLPASAKLEEHQRGYWCDHLGLPYPSSQFSLGELELLYIRTSWVPNPPDLTLDEARHRYFQQRSGLPAGMATTDYMQDFFLSPGPVEVRRNLFLNPAGAGAKAWTSIGNHAVTANGTQAAGGPVANARWQKFTLTEVAAGTQVIACAASGLNGMPALGGTQYIVSGYGLRSAGTATQMGLYQVEEYDAAGVLISAAILTIPAAPAAGAWGRSSQVITTDPNTRFLVPKMRFSSASMAIGDYFGVGAILAELGSTLNPYFDGGFASAQWAGTVDDSASILLG